MRKLLWYHHDVRAANSRIFRTYIPRGAGGISAVHKSLTTVTRVQFRLRAVIWFKLPWPRLRRVLSSLSQPSTGGFIRIPPVVTLYPWGVALTGPPERTAEAADRVIQYKYTLRLLYRIYMKRIFLWIDQCYRIYSLSWFFLKSAKPYKYLLITNLPLQRMNVRRT